MNASTSDRGARAMPAMPVASLVELLQRWRVEHRVQQLIELLRSDAQHGFLLVDQAFVHHVDRDANRGRTGALAVAGLQHVELAVLTVNSKSCMSL